jgi:SAM-dependent methyltransferase
MAQDLLVDPAALRDQVRAKYREVALDPGAGFHFHTGRGLASRLGYDDSAVGALPDRANLCADKQAVFAEIRRVLRPGGWLQFADIANGRPVPVEAMRDIDLWTG